MTAEQLWEMPEAPGKRYELVKGELVEMPGAAGVHGLIVELVLRLVGAHVRERRLGVVFGDGVGYILGRRPDVVRIPDASFLSHARIPEGGVPEGFIPLSPDLAVEIVSPNDTASELWTKVREYLEAGTRLVWVLWPRDRRVTAYAPGGAYREYSPDDELDGGDILPGFHVRVSELFDIGH
jgi:Uma2 family endonuclease